MNLCHNTSITGGDVHSRAMFALSAIRTWFAGSSNTTNSSNSDDIWLGGFDFFIQYVYQRLYNSNVHYSPEQYDNVVEWLRTYYRTKLQNVRVIHVRNSTFAELSDVVEGKNQKEHLRNVVYDLNGISWNERALALHRLGSWEIITDHSLHRHWGKVVCSDDTSTCTITAYDYPPRNLPFEHVSELCKMDEQERCTTAIFAFYGSKLEEVEEICKKHPMLNSWFHQSNFLERRAEFQKSYPKELLEVAARLEESFSLKPYTYLRIRERAQVNKLLINFLAYDKIASENDITTLIDRLRQLIALFNLQPSRAANPIRQFQESWIADACRDYLNKG